MSITMNLYYTGKDGNARKFAEEMEQSGTAALIRAEDGNEKYDYFFPMRKTSENTLQYFGLAICGSKKKINQLTGSLPLLR